MLKPGCQYILGGSARLPESSLPTYTNFSTMHDIVYTSPLYCKCHYLQTYIAMRLYICVRFCHKQGCKNRTSNPRLRVSLIFQVSGLHLICNCCCSPNIACPHSTLETMVHMLANECILNTKSRFFISVHTSMPRI